MLTFTLFDVINADYDGNYIQVLDKQDFISMLAILDDVLTNFSDGIF